MFKKRRFDEILHYEMRELRLRMLERFPKLKDRETLRMVMLAKGELQDIRDVKPTSPRTPEAVYDIDQMLKYVGRSESPAWPKVENNKYVSPILEEVNDHKRECYNN